MLDELALYGHTREFVGGDDVVRPGDMMSALIYVVKGSLSQLSESDKGVVMLQHFGKGNVANVEGFFDRSQRTPRLVADGGTQVSEISYKRVDHLLQTTLRGSGLDILKGLAHCLAVQADAHKRRIEILALAPVAERLLKALNDVAALRGTTCIGGRAITVARSELAQMTGSVIDVVCRNLGKLEAAGKIRRSGKAIIVIDRRTV